MDSGAYCRRQKRLCVEMGHLKAEIRLGPESSQSPRRRSRRCLRVARFARARAAVPTPWCSSLCHIAGADQLPTWGRKCWPDASEGETNGPPLVPLLRARRLDPPDRASCSNTSPGSPPITRTTSMNSITSSRRSPPSYLATNDCGRLSRAATSACVRPADLRAEMHSSQRARCSGLRRDLLMRRRGGTMSRRS